MSEDKQAPDLIAQLDQMEVNLENTAKILGTYYRSLIKSGVHVDLADKLVLEFHNLFWVSVLQNQKPDDQSPHLP